MKINIVFLLISFFSINTAYTQNISVSNEDNSSVKSSKEIVLDICTIGIQYEMTIVNDVNNPTKKKTYSMFLQIGKRISKFSDYTMLRIDSLSQVYSKQNRNSLEAIGSMFPTTKNLSGLNIFKNYPNEKITVADRVPLTGNIKYEEKKIKPRWEFVQGTMNVCGNECKKAITTFRGRNYIAWYAPKIPISDGPWKFWGLPGLILKITDDKSEYSFECVAIEKPKYVNKIYIVDNYINTTKAKFDDTFKKFYENPRAAMEASGKIKSGLPDKIKSRPYNPIELSE